MDQKLDKISNKQATEDIQQIAQTTPSVSIEEIKSIVSQYVRVLGLSNDSHFEANRKNIVLLNNNILKTKKLVEDIQIPENIVQVDIKPQVPKMIGFGIFKIRKTSLIMALLGILIFALTIFCMKQQNDYAILQSRFSWQSSVIRQLQIENDSLKVRNVALLNKKKK